MTRWIVAVSIFTLGVVGLGGAPSPAAAGDVRVGVNIGVPAPVVVAHPAPVFVAPAPPVIIASGVPVYYYGTHYYTHYNGAWFYGSGYGGPWAYVPVARVPRPIIAVPHAYVRMPPGHARHIAGPPPWGHGHGGGGRGHGHGHGHHRN
jgi:hypothetical protein